MQDANEGSTVALEKKLGREPTIHDYFTQPERLTSAQRARFRAQALRSSSRAHAELSIARNLGEARRSSERWCAIQEREADDHCPPSL